MQTPNYPGDKQASEILQRADCHFGLGDLKALMAGTLLGFKFIQPTVVLDYIEFGEIVQPGFGDKKLAQDFLGIFFGLWNEAANHRNPSHPFSFSQADSFWPAEDASHWCNFAERLESEVGNFLVGLELSQTPTLVDLIKSKKRNVDGYLPQVLANLMGDLEKERIKLQKKKSQDGSAVKKIAQAIESELKILHGPFLEEMTLLQINKSSKRASPSTRDEPKVGRNDPCPCGSGKKFKQCCLQ